MSCRFISPISQKHESPIFLVQSQLIFHLRVFRRQVSRRLWIHDKSPSNSPPLPFLQTSFQRVVRAAYSCKLTTLSRTLPLRRLLPPPVMLHAGPARATLFCLGRKRNRHGRRRQACTSASRNTPMNVAKFLHLSHSSHAFCLLCVRACVFLRSLPASNVSSPTD